MCQTSKSNLPEAVELPNRLGLMLDYDGTLTPIVSKPEQAMITPDKLALLHRLAENRSLQLAIVSGRSIEQLEFFLSGLLDCSLILCGVHGGEIRKYPENISLRTPPDAVTQLVADFKIRLTAVLQEKALLERVLLEDKTHSLAFHLRLTPPELKALAATCFQEVYQSEAIWQQTFRVQPGQEVLELLPKAFDKGGCVLFVADYWQEKAKGHGLSLAYVGDDLTDEYAFVAMNQLGGRSIRIGQSSCNSQANLHFPSVESLYTELQTLLDTAVGSSFFLNKAP